MEFRDTRILVVDTETTGIDPKQARVVEIGGVFYEPKNGRRALQRYINPGCPIPAEATALHRITDSMVADAPSFREAAEGILTRFEDADVVMGYNLLDYDLPLLEAEFARAGFPTTIDRSKVIDLIVFARWHLRDHRSRKLGDVCAHYGVDLKNAHSAKADAVATHDLLYYMLDSGVVPTDVEKALAQQAKMVEEIKKEADAWSYWLYRDRKFPSVIRLGAGKHVGRPLSAVPKDYLRFLLKKLDDLHPGAASAFKNELNSRDSQ